MSKIEELLSLKKLPAPDDLIIRYEDFAKLYWKCRGVIKNQERNTEFWEATNKNLSLAYDKLNQQEKELSSIYGIIKKDLDLAATIQKQMLPKKIPLIEKYSLGVACNMAEESGGDFYDIIQLDEHRFFLLIGDVSGKGLPASLYMSSCINIIRALIEDITKPEKHILSKILIKVNKLLGNIMRGDSFITLFLSIIDTSSHMFTYLSAGHMPVIVFKPQAGEISLLNTPGIVCGVLDSEQFAANIEEASVPIEEGTYFIFYTDGITESVNGEGLNYENLFYQSISSLSGSEPADQVIRLLLEKRAEFMGSTPQQDDITLLCFLRHE